MQKNSKRLKSKVPIISLIAITLFFLVLIAARMKNHSEASEFITYTLDPTKQNIDLYWRKNDTGAILNSIHNLKSFVESKNKKLLFATNAGMYHKNFYPVGLFIQNYKTITPIDTSSGNGNFYLKPNGIFYCTNDNKAFVCKTEDFKDTGNVRIATQSGPMLLIDGEIHPAFQANSKSYNIRNGVGILPDNTILFVLSKNKINFYDFARYFKSLGCKNALYLDGFVSRAYVPAKGWEQFDGNFGVMVGEEN